MTVQGNVDNWAEMSNAVLVALKHWGNAALKYTRQRHHMMEQPAIGLHPPAAIVEAQMLKRQTSGCGSHGC